LFPDIILKTADFSISLKNFPAIAITFLFFIVFLVSSTLVLVLFLSTYLLIACFIFGQLEFTTFIELFDTLDLLISSFCYDYESISFIIDIYTNRYDCFRTFTQKNINLDNDISSIEWAYIIENELDIDYFIPGDLAVACGKGYIMDMISAKLDHSRQLFYVGKRFMQFGTVPLSGYSSQPDIPFNFDRTYDLPYYKFKDRPKFIESYNEYGFYNLEVSGKSNISFLLSDTIKDYYGYTRKLSHHLAYGKITASEIDKGISMMDGFLM
jgi:hypothetical protein